MQLLPELENDFKIHYDCGSHMLYCTHHAEVHYAQVVELIRSGNGPKKFLVIDTETEREMAAKVCLSTYSKPQTTLQCSAVFSWQQSSAFATHVYTYSCFVQRLNHAFMSECRVCEGHSVIVEHKL